MNKIYLRSLEPSDISRTYKWHNDHDLYDSLIGTFHYISHISEQVWLSKICDHHDDKQHNLAICLTKNLQHIGNIYLRNIDWVARHGELHIFIGDKKYQSKGYGYLACRTLINHAFKDLGLLRLYCHVLEYNKKAISLYKKCGFIEEGRLRNHSFKNGGLENVVIMGICVNDIIK